MAADRPWRGSGTRATVPAVHVDPAAAVAELFAPERPGPLIHAHITAMGLGRCRADRAPTPARRWPSCRAATWRAGAALLVPDLRGFVEAPPAWVHGAARHRRIRRLGPHRRGAAGRRRPRGAATGAAAHPRPTRPALPRWNRRSAGSPRRGVGTPGSPRPAWPGGRSTTDARSRSRQRSTSDGRTRTSVGHRAGPPRPGAFHGLRRRTRRRHPGPRGRPSWTTSRTTRPGAVAARLGSSPSATTCSTPSGSPSAPDLEARGAGRATVGDVPEGDTVHLAGKRLHAALAGRRLLRGELRHPRLAEQDLAGRTVLGVKSVGKHLLTRFDDGRSLHSHFRMDGAWHLYRPGWPGLGRLTKPARCWRPRSGWPSGSRCTTWSCCPPTPRTGSSAISDRTCSTRMGDAHAAEALRRFTARRGHELGLVLLEQRVMAGVGNLYKAEMCFLLGLSPWTLVSDVPDPSGAIGLARELLLRNRTGPSSRPPGSSGGTASTGCSSGVDGAASAAARGSRPASRATASTPAWRTEVEPAVPTRARPPYRCTAPQARARRGRRRRTVGASRRAVSWCRAAAPGAWPAGRPGPGRRRAGPR